MALKKSKKTKTGKADSSVKNTKTKTDSRRATKKTTAARKSAPAQKKTVAGRTTKKKASKSKQSIKESTTMEAKSKKSASSKKTAASVTDTKSGLLRQSKTTSAALSHLEKGIELIYKKDYKKAYNELSKISQSFPEETEILARAQSYSRICEREEASPQKVEASSDQLYTLGVLEHNKANYDAAISYFNQSLKAHPDADYIYYSVAASQAMKGDLPESMENLKKAVELNEDSRIHAKNDEDFSAFEADEEFAELVGILQNPGNEPQ